MKLNQNIIQIIVKRQVPPIIIAENKMHLDNQPQPASNNQQQQCRHDKTTKNFLTELIMAWKDWKNACSINSGITTHHMK